VVTGVVLLLQSFHRRATNRLPAVADVLRWLKQGAAVIEDGDDEDDNVLHTGLTFARIDAVAALRSCGRDLLINELASAGDGFGRATERPARRIGRRS
jgi:hypothetical protein